MAVVNKLRDDEGGLASVAVIAGSRLPDEDAWAASKLARTVLRTDDVDFRTRFAPEGESAELACLAGRDTATYADVEAAPVILTVGLDPEEEVPILHLRIRKAWRNHTAKIVPVGPRAGSLERYAWRRLQTGIGQETGALAALARAVGVSSLADVAASSGYTSGHLDDVVASLRGDGSTRHPRRRTRTCRRADRCGPAGRRGRGQGRVGASRFQRPRCPGRRPHRRGPARWPTHGRPGRPSPGRRCLG
jgi:predicted molibdopterin-dependent oxidoreductase YjgC